MPKSLILNNSDKAIFALSDVIFGSSAQSILSSSSPNPRHGCKPTTGHQLPVTSHPFTINLVPSESSTYRGRLAPSPTGLMHLGHASTFWIAARRAAEHGGQLILRNEDLDSQRCRPEFVQAMLEDLRWL